MQNIFVSIYIILRESLSPVPPAHRWSAAALHGDRLRLPALTDAERGGLYALCLRRPPQKRVNQSPTKSMEVPSLYLSTTGKESRIPALVLSI